MAWDPSHSPAVTTPVVVSRLKLMPGLIVALLSSSVKPGFGEKRADRISNSPVILRLRRAQLAYLRGLAGASACRGVIAAALAADVLLEHRIVALEENGDVVPERRGKLCRHVGDPEETTVRVLDRVQNLPGWIGLVRIRGDVGVVDRQVQDTESHRVHIINAFGKD